MGKTVVIVGQTATGKTTLANRLVDAHGFKKIVTYTTRPIRQGEQPGKDYFFISTPEFLKKKKQHFFQETTVYRTAYGGEWYYGSAVEDYNSDGFENKVIVLNPIGVMKVPRNAFVVWLDIPNQLAIRRALKRGDRKEEVQRRMREDARRFEKMEKTGIVDLRITDDLETDVVANIIANTIKCAGVVNRWRWYKTIG